MLQKLSSNVPLALSWERTPTFPPPCTLAPPDIFAGQWWLETPLQPIVLCPRRSRSSSLGMWGIHATSILGTHRRSWFLFPAHPPCTTQSWSLHRSICGEFVSSPSQPPTSATWAQSQIGSLFDCSLRVAQFQSFGSLESSHVVASRCDSQAC